MLYTESAIFSTWEITQNCRAALHSDSFAWVDCATYQNSILACCLESKSKCVNSFSAEPGLEAAHIHMRMENSRIQTIKSNEIKEPDSWLFFQLLFDESSSAIVKKMREKKSQQFLHRRVLRAAKRVESKLKLVDTWAISRSHGCLLLSRF